MMLWLLLYNLEQYFVQKHWSKTHGFPIIIWNSLENVPSDFCESPTQEFNLMATAVFADFVTVMVNIILMLHVVLHFNFTERDAGVETVLSCL